MLTLVAALVLSLSACDVWDQAGRLPDASRFNPEEVAITPSNAASLSDAWSAQVTGSFSEPVLSGNRLYTTAVSGRSGLVRSYDVDTGAVLWEQPVPAPANPGSPGPVVLVGGALWVSHSGTGGAMCSALLTRLDPATGNVLTTETTGPALIGPIVASGPTVAFVTRTGCGQTGNRAQLVVRDPNSPAGNWSFSFPEGVDPALDGPRQDLRGR